MSSKGMFWQAVERLKNPEHVATFQRWFGVEEVKRNFVRQHAPFISQNVDDLKKQKRRAPAAAAPARRFAHLSASEEDNCSTDADASAAAGGAAAAAGTASSSNWSLTQSGADVDKRVLTERELADKNVVYYRTTSKFWHYLFLFGTQLGDEVYQ